MAKFHKALLLLAIAGIITSTYLIYHHYEVRLGGTASWCKIAEEFSCDIVALSSYSTFLGVPVAFYGLAWFAFVVVLYYHERIHFVKKLVGKNAPLYLLLGSVASMAFVAWLVYAETFVIHSICLGCTIAHVIGVGVLVIAVTSFKKPLL